MKRARKIPAPPLPFDAFPKHARAEIKRLRDKEVMIAWAHRERRVVPSLADGIERLRQVRERASA